MDAETLATLAWVLAGGSAAARRASIDEHGGVQAALDAGPAAWSRAGLDPAAQQRLKAPPADVLARACAWLAQPGHHLVGWSSPDYPPLLRRIASPPVALFVDGEPAALWHPGIAVVGSRSPTAGGRDNARDFSRAFAVAGFSVLSGLAAGVDASAHQAALEVAAGATVAVIGTGPDLTYPAAHGALHRRIAAGGAVVSEHPPGTPARPSHFPSRNRLLAGLALGTLVVEAAERSGALITARQSAESGREVFALPGSIHNPLSRGCHRLIRDGAALVERPQEVVDALAPVAQDLAQALRARLAPEPGSPHISRDPSSTEADPDYNSLWRALGHDPIPMDLLVLRTGLTAAALSSMLLVMELDGRVAVQHGRYMRRS